MRRDFDRIVTFNNGIFKNDVTESCPRLVRIHTAVTLEEDAEVGISHSINDNVVVDKRLVTPTSAQANEGTPCCILAVDEVYNVLRRKLWKVGVLLGP
jgi:hypothetical protein